MENILTYIKIVTAGAGATLGMWFGEMDIFFKILIALAILDYFTGVCSSIYNKTTDSKIGFKGIIKKVAIFVIVVLANLLDMAIGQELIRNAVIFFYIANEGISILENCGKMDLPLPEVLQSALTQLQTDSSAEITEVIDTIQDGEEQA